MYLSLIKQLLYIVKEWLKTKYLKKKKPKIMADAHYCTANRRGQGGGSRDRYPLLGLQKSLQTVTAVMKSKTIVSWQENDDKPRQCVKKQRCYSANKSTYSQGYGLFSGHVHL